MSYQRTKLNIIIDKVTSNLSLSILGPWKRRSIGLISLLMGYYVGSNISVYYLEQIGQRPFSVIIMVFFIELAVRYRTRASSDKIKTHILVLDNFRIGTVYSVVLEAFKLGS